MKKQVALLLAFIMMISAMPVTIFAASENRLSRGTLTIPRQTVLFDQVLAPNLIANESQNMVGTQRTGNGRTITNYVQGMDLVLDLRDRATSGQAFRIELDNAEWFFDNSANGLTGATVFAYDNHTDNQRIFPVAGEAFTYLYNDDKNINFLIQVSPFNRRSAVVTFLGDDVDDPTSLVTRMSMRVPLLLYVENEGVEVTARITDSNAPITTASYLVATTAAGATSTSAETIKTGREKIALDTIRIRETKNDSINARGGIELVAPRGYFFRDTFSTASPITITTEPGLGNVVDWGWKWTDTRDNTSVALFINMDSTSEGRIAGSINISGLEIEPLDSEAIHFGETLRMDISNFQNFRATEEEHNDWLRGGSRTANYTSVPTYLDTSLGIRSESFDVAKAVDWVVLVTANAEPTTLISGRSTNDPTSSRHETVKVSFDEQEAGAWLASRTTTFRLPEEVKIIGVKFDTLENVSTLVSNKTIRVDANDNSNETRITDGAVTISDNEMTIRNLAVDDINDRVKIEFKLYVSIDPNFEGDINLQTGGTAITDELDPVTIATAVPPIVLTSRSTDVQIGYQRYSIADIVISETQAGAIETGQLILRIDDFARNNSMNFVPITPDNIEVTDGDISVSSVNARNGTIVLDVNRTSRTASSITLRNLELRIDRTVPWGSYDLVAFGDSIFQNYRFDESGNLTRRIGTFGTFDEGIRLENYINVVTEGALSGLNNHVVITEGSNIILVNGEEVTMDTAAIIDPTSHSLLIPLRAASNALGIPNSSVFWDESTRSATIVSESNNRTIILTAESDTIVINGARHTMVTNGYNVSARIINDRMFVPFRYVATGLGISDENIAWNESTRTAEFNPTASY